TAGSAPNLVRLKQEARAMAEMTHPAIAQIHSLETWRDRPLLIVEFLPGGTLAARLDRGPLPAPDAIGIAVTVAEAIQTLHDTGYLHRDVKPSNIGFTADGSPKLLDFGLAHLVGTSDAPAGTVPYLSPEVLRGHPAGEADDVWSLGVVMYEMVAGRNPFAGGSVDDVIDRILHQQIPRPPSESDRTSALTVQVGSMLTAAASARPRTAREFAGVLRRL
ncbi:MAG: serine/threonine-protein kinase, partial [Rhodospirillaceae bacterium]|nr:serine/threonine-protein kinase [Rhodospirillaceae bacterium]